MSDQLAGMENGFPPHIFILPMKERKRKFNATQYFKSILPDWRGGEIIYELSEKDIDRAKMLFEQGVNVYVAMMVEYSYLEEPVRLRLFRVFPAFTGVVSEIDDVHRLGRYLDAGVIEL